MAKFKDFFPVSIQMRKPKRPSLQTMKKKYWALFSQYIRRRDADENGMVKCISCPKIKHYSEMDCGHFLPKSLGLSIYFEERNVANQCQFCNLALQGNQYEYALALKKKYGEGIVDELNEIRRKPVKYSRADYESMIEVIKDKLEKL